MLEGMYSAAAGMAAQQQRLDAIVNDIANVNTTGYKQRPRRVPRPPLHAPGWAPLAASPRAPAPPHAHRPRRRPGRAPAHRPQPLDVAIRAPASSQVRRPDGTQVLTRDGAPPLDAQGRLGTRAATSSSPGITLPAGTADADVNDQRRRPRHRRRPPGRPHPPRQRRRAADGLQPLGDNVFAADRRERRGRAPPARTRASAGRARGLQRRHRRRDGRHDGGPARLRARQPRPSRRRTARRDRQRDQAMSHPAPDRPRRRCPRDVRNGTADAARSTTRAARASSASSSRSSPRRSPTRPSRPRRTSARPPPAPTATCSRTRSPTPSSPPAASASPAQLVEGAAVVSALADPYVPSAALGIGREVLAHLDEQLASAAPPARRRPAPGRAIRAPRRRRRARLPHRDPGRDGAPRPPRARPHRRCSPAPPPQLGVARRTSSRSTRSHAHAPAEGDAARERSAELRGLLAEVGRQHGINRVLMRQELAFLEHLTRLLGGEEDAGYAPPAARLDSPSARRAAAPPPTASWT